MLEDHGKINILLDYFLKQVEKNFNNYDEVFSRFNQFKWALEKHFFVEEKVIFSVYSLDDENEEDIFNLLKDHKDILWIINRIEEDLEDNIKPKIRSLKENLRRHIMFENNKFYPLLDEMLDEKQKQLILNRSKEVVR